MRLVPALLALLLLLAAACDGDSGDDIAATVLPETPEASPTADGAEPTATPTPAPDGEPTPTEQPAASPTPETEDGETPAPAPAGTPAVGPADPGPYEGTSLEQSPCSYNRVDALANCPGYGVYSPSPAPTGQDITCSLFLADGQPALVFCRSAEPVQSTYYEIQ